MACSGTCQPWRERKGGGQEEQRQQWQEVGAGAKARRGFSGTGSHRRKLPPEAGTGEVEAAGTIARDGRGREDGGEMDQERKSVEMGQEASVGGSQGVGGGGGLSDYTVFPRRKVGRSSRAPGGGNSRAPVVLSEEKLRECFDLPLHVASKKMGICITAIKKVPHVGVPGLGCICAHTCIHAHTYAHTCAHTKSSDL